MYPFFVLMLSADASDEEVERRYHELVEQYPPDRAPEEFHALRRAFEALRDQEARLQTRLFYSNKLGLALEETRLPWPRPGREPRIGTEELARLLRGSDASRGQR